MNVAIVGIGKWGKNLISEFGKKAEVSYCISQGSQENILWVNENFPNVKCTTSLEEALDDESIDAVVISTPINTHYEVARKSLSAKKHVFVEKPTATNITEYKSLNSLAEKNNSVLFTGYVFLYHDIYKFIKSNIDTKQLKSIVFEWNKLGTFDDNIYWSLLSHDIAMCVDFLGMPKDVRLLHSIGVKTEADDILVELHYPNLLRVTISINRSSQKKSKRLTMEDASSFHVWEGDSLFRKENGKKTLILKETNSALSNEVETFLECADKGEYYYDKVASETIALISGIKE